MFSHKLSAGIRILGLFVLLAAVFLSFQLGRYRAGFSILDMRRSAESQRMTLTEQAARIAELERNLAITETARQVERETYLQVETNLGELEQQIQLQQQELAFYQGIVSPPDGAAGLRLQSLEVQPRRGERAYLVTVVLVQAVVHSERLTGSVGLSLVGDRDGVQEALDIRELVTASGLEQNYDFLYFQEFDYDIELPLGFEPEQFEITIRPSQRGQQVIRETLRWPE